MLPLCWGGVVGQSNVMEAPDVFGVLQADAAERDPDEELERLGLCELSQEQMNALGRRFYDMFRATEGYVPEASTGASSSGATTSSVVLGNAPRTPMKVVGFAPLTPAHGGRLVPRPPGGHLVPRPPVGPPPYPRPPREPPPVPRPPRGPPPLEAYLNRRAPTPITPVRVIGKTPMTPSWPIGKAVQGVPGLGPKWRPTVQHKVHVPGLRGTHRPVVVPAKRQLSDEELQRMENLAIRPEVKRRWPDGRPRPGGGKLWQERNDTFERSERRMEERLHEAFMQGKKRKAEEIAAAAAAEAEDDANAGN